MAIPSRVQRVSVSRLLSIYQIVFDEDLNSHLEKGGAWIRDLRVKSICLVSRFFNFWLEIFRHGASKGSW